MPELPEVETTRRGIAPLVSGQKVRAVIVRQPRLRQRVPVKRLQAELPGWRIERVERRAKYLLLGTGNGTLLIHLGMSGSLRVLPENEPPGPHDHVDVRFGAGRCLRLRDPRRFGLVLWTRRDPLRHPLLRDLGPEPFDSAFDGAYLHRHASGRRIAVKSYLMDGRIVVGVGNIYASEALFRAGIDPRRAAGRIAAARYERLAGAVREVLAEAIEAGVTTLRDFSGSDGRPGYFQMRLAVYGRADEPCPVCATLLRTVRLGQRSTFFCSRCQR